MFLAGREPWRESDQLSGPTKIIIFVGDLSPIKGITSCYIPYNTEITDDTGTYIFYKSGMIILGDGANGQNKPNPA